MKENLTPYGAIPLNNNMEGRDNEADFPRGEREQRRLTPKHRGTRRQSIRRSAEESIEENEELMREQIADEEERARQERERIVSEIAKKADEEISSLEAGGNVKPEAEIKEGVWHAHEHDNRVRILGEPEVGPDGRLYVRVLNLEFNSEGYAPLDEVEANQTEEPQEPQPAQAGGTGGDNEPPEEPPAPPSPQEPEEGPQDGPILEQLRNLNPDEITDPVINQMLEDILDFESDPELIETKDLRDIRRELAKALRERRVDEETARVLRERLKNLQDSVEENRREIREKGPVDASEDKELDNEHIEKLRRKKEKQPKPPKASREVEDELEEKFGDDEETKDIIRAQIADGKKKSLDYTVTDKIVENIINNIDNNDLEEARGRIDDLSHYVEALGKGDDKVKGLNILSEEDLEFYRNQISEARTADPQHLKELVNDLKESLRKHYARPEARQVRETDIKSIDDLAHLIMQSEEDKWRSGGKYELIRKNKETGEEEFVPQHFLAWVRSRINYYHDQNPDSEINLFQQIAIPTTYRSISISEVIDTAKYMMKREMRVGEAEIKEGKIEFKTKENYSKTEELENLRMALLYEVWMFNENHKYDAKYRLGMGSEKQVAETLAEVHYNNVFTKDRGRLLRILKFASVTSETRQDGTNVPLDQAFNEIFQEGYDNQKTQGEVGRMIRRGILAYYHLADMKGEDNMFEKVMNSGTQNQEGMRGFYRSLFEQVFKEELKAAKENKENNLKLEKGVRQVKTKFDIFSDNGDMNLFKNVLAERGIEIADQDLANLDNLDRLKDLALRAVNFRIFRHFALDEKGEIMTDAGGTPIKSTAGVQEWSKTRQANLNNLNIYRINKLEQPLVNLVRNAVKAGVATAEGVSQEDQALDVDYADNWTFAFTYWTGISAQNDVLAIGFDKYSNVVNLSAYRRRQSRGRGPYGMDQTVFGIQRLNLIFWQALKARREGVDTDFNIPLIEALQGGEGDEVNLSNQIIDFDLQGNAQRQHFVEQISNGFKLASQFIDGYGINFQEILKRSSDYLSFGKINFDYKKANELINDGVWHDLRYTFDQPGFNWNRKIRTWRMLPEKDDQGNVIYETDNEGKLLYGKPVPKMSAQFGTWTIREIMFNEEVNGMDMYERPEVVAEQNPDEAVARNVFAWLVAKELAWHREWRGGQARWGLEEVELVKDYFKQWAFGVHEEEKNGKKVVVPNASFFSKEELNKIAETGDVSFWKLLLQELTTAIAGGLAEGTVKGGIKLTKSSFATAA